MPRCEAKLESPKLANLFFKHNYKVFINIKKVSSRPKYRCQIKDKGTGTSIEKLQTILSPRYLHRITHLENVHHILEIKGHRWNDIWILLPSDGYKDLINHKGRPSYTLQTVVDNRYWKESALNVALYRLALILWS